MQIQIDYTFEAMRRAIVHTEKIYGRPKGVAGYPMARAIVAEKRAPQTNTKVCPSCNQPYHFFFDIQEQVHIQCAKDKVTALDALEVEQSIRSLDSHRKVIFVIGDNSLNYTGAENIQI